MKKPCNVLNTNFSDYLTKNFFVYFYVKNAFQYIYMYFFQFFILFLTGAVLEPLSFNMVKKFWYILYDLFIFFQILKSDNFFKWYLNEIFKKLDTCFSTKNYEEYLKHHRQILIELSRNAPYIYKAFQPQ